MGKSIAASTYTEARHALDNADHAGADGLFLEELEHLKAGAGAVDVATRTAVLTARANGASWSDVGRALSITKQAAWERYGRD